jgi:hypothetical protein
VAWFAAIEDRITPRRSALLLRGSRQQSGKDVSSKYKETSEAGLAQNLTLY